MTMTSLLKSAGIVILSSALLIPLWLSNDAAAELVPEWVKNTAKWFGDDLISEEEFLNAIKYLIDNQIIILDSENEDKVIESTDQGSSIEYVIIPNGNSLQDNTGFYLPINLEIKTDTTVVWQNNDNFAHTVQSQDMEGKASGLFSSSLLNTGESFTYRFIESGEYHYYCTIHPWRVGVITVR